MPAGAGPCFPRPACPKPRGGGSTSELWAHSAMNEAAPVVNQTSAGGAPSDGGTPAPPPPSPPAPPAPPRAARLLPLLPAPLRPIPGWLLRHPWKVLVAAGLSVLVVAGAILGGNYALAVWHWHAARSAVDQYHTAEAQRHLVACLPWWPDDPTTLLMAARTARRT